MQLSSTLPTSNLRRSPSERREGVLPLRPAAQGGGFGSRPDGGAPAPSFRVDWAQSPADLEEAQRLRFKVFAGETGARLQVPEDSPDACDVDRFDPFCEHLLVRVTSGPQRGEVIATCRVLTPCGALRAGRLYTDTEFDLDPLRDLLPRALEMGRVCVEPAWRNGLVVMALWRELGKRMAEQNLETLIGCASIGLQDGGDAAAGLWHLLKRTHLVATARRVRPWKALTLRADGEKMAVAVPPLIKAYLRCGGKLLGPPAIDADFNTADFPMLMHLGDLPSRYGKRIFGASA